MANDTILTPGGEHWEPTQVLDDTNQYLERDKFLSEYETEGEKAVVRENLDVYAKESVYTRQESDIKLDESIKKAFDKYLNLEDPHGILPVVRLMIKGFVKEDGNTPFIAPQAGVDPVQDFHLATKRFVTKILRDHLSEKDPHRILPEVEDMLEQYVKQSEIYFRNQLYTKNEIDAQSGRYIKKDGTTPFTKAQIGADPQIDSHLATKRYVDKVIYNHLVDVDPHGFIAILNQRLASYAKANNVYDKSQTYSRVLMDSIIRGLVGEAAKEVLNDHLNAFDPHNILAEVRKERYVKQDGTIPFRAPLKGVDAVDPQDLVTLHQVEEQVAEAKKVAENIPEPIWITSGPVESTVGYVEDNTPVPDTMTLQEIMDAIFYGKGVCLEVPDYVILTNTCPITVCIHGSTGLIDYAELLLDGEIIHHFIGSDFEDGCITVDSLPIAKDTEFTFKVYYTNGAVGSDSKTVTCSYPVFVGLLPKWKFGNTVTMEYLNELHNEDPSLNQFIACGKDVESIPFTYDFSGTDAKHLFVVIPESYPKLTKMTTQSQEFGIEAFDVIDMIPLLVYDLDIVYTMYIYRQALYSLNQGVTFNFKS